MRRLLLGSVCALLFISPTFGQEVQVFLTSDALQANFTPTAGGLAGADQKCTEAAQAAGLTGNWTAWLSDSNTDARDRIIDARYVLLDGTVVADDLADLTDGSLDHAIDMNESMGQGSGAVFTSTLIDGTLDPDSNACLDWTVNAGQAGIGVTVGDSLSVNELWTDTGVIEGCGNVRGLYCFAAFEVPVELQKFSVE